MPEMDSCSWPTSSLAVYILNRQNETHWVSVTGFWFSLVQARCIALDSGNPEKGEREKGGGVGGVATCQAVWSSWKATSHALAAWRSAGVVVGEWSADRALNTDA